MGEETKKQEKLKINVIRFLEIIIKCGGKPYLMDYDDYNSLEEIVKKLDGVLISGGRDMNPQFYNEIKNGTIQYKGWNNRFIFYKKILDICDKKLPIFGICYGSQFINVYFGGKLIQDIKDEYKDQHNDINNIIFKEDLVL